jgi:predicted naringenin-chalcone synthase
MNSRVTSQATPEGKAHIASVGLAVPAMSIDQSASLDHLLSRFSGTLKKRSISLMRKLFEHPGIRKRHFAIEDPVSFFSESPDDRINRFTKSSIELSSQAVLTALGSAGLSTDDLFAVVVNTCTGYICPGISTYLVENLGLRRDIKVYDLVGSGCGGAIPNLEIAESLLEKSGDKVVASISVEVCSATFQMGDDLSLLVSNALFGDGAAAVVLWKRSQGIELVASSSCYVPEDREAIRFVHKEGQLYNQLSTSLPHLVRKAVARVVDSLLTPRSLRTEDIMHWAIHTGGEKIINTIKDELGLSEAQVGPTRKILREFGNMSSPTVFFVLDELLQAGMDRGEWCMMLAFGAGLSAHGFLLRKY